MEQPNPVSRYDELCAVQQALMWALEPETYEAPYDLLVSSTDTLEGVRDCPAGNDRSGSLDISDHRAASQ